VTRATGMAEVTAPVARVAVDIPLAHLDRLFDYSIPPALADEAVPGCRVRVRFAGRLVDGFIVERVADSDYRLAPLAKVVSPIPVLTPSTYRLCRAVADRYAGTLVDVLRAAIPSRHARAEASVLTAAAAARRTPPAAAGSADDGGSRWSGYVGGAALLRRVSAGEAPRAVWTAGPAEDWPARIVELATAAERAGRGFLAVLPDARDVQRLDAAMAEGFGPGHHEMLTAAAGPQRRYASFLRLLTGRVRMAIGTRSASFAPVPDRSLLLIWEDGEDTLVDPQAPGWHAREVLALRSHLFDTALIAGGFTRSIVAESWLDSGWAQPVIPTRSSTRERAPRVIAIGEDEGRAPARLPERAWSIARDALATGPVLVQVARRGYVPALACQRCRSIARCSACGGPLSLPAPGSAALCAWCHTSHPQWRCPECGDTRLRARARGATRTAEELGRAFPHVAVIASGGDRIVDRVGGDPALVVATPGAEPVADGGYAAVLLLDAEAMLARASLSAGEETLRRWFTAASLARPAAPVVITADARVPAVASLARFDPGWFAERDLSERRILGLPPVRRAAVVTGSFESLDELRRVLPDTVTVHGPLEVAGSDSDRARLLLLSDRDDATAMTRSLTQFLATRSARGDTKADARKDRRGVEVRVDPVDWGVAEHA
jgi:primosomal protein N' (replication factor Y) (superfamily II helicase)